MSTSTFAVVVTFNRANLLLECLSALASQTQCPDQILIVDNASTDGTCELLASAGWLSRKGVQLLRLAENTGGAGGFSAGLREAMGQGADWVWMMDDDACPTPTALEELSAIALESTNVYGSLAVCGTETSWPVTMLELGQVVHQADEVPRSGRVEFIPFLGFLIHRALIEKIGFPDSEYFIAADDVEYCLRARRAGAAIVIAGQSRIEHPRVRQKVIRLLGVRVVYLSLPAWKRYYDTRNRLLIARRYYGLRLLTQTVPGSILRLLIALSIEPNKWGQLRAFFAGIVDGLAGIKGKRHEKWRISV